MFGYFTAYLLEMKSIARIDKSESFNRLASQVLAALQTNEVICCIAARSLLWFYLFQPWRVLIFDNELRTRFLELGPYMVGIAAALDLLIHNPEIVFDSTSYVFASQVVRQVQMKYRKQHQEEYDCLMKIEATRKTKVCEIIKSMAIQLRPYFKEICGDFLPGGKYAEPGADMMKKYAHVPAHNMAAERSFSLVKQANVAVPNLSLDTTIGIAVVRGNKAWEFLRGLPIKFRELIINFIRENSKRLRAQRKQQATALQLRVQEDQVEKQKKAEAAEKKKLEQIAKDFMHADLFTTEQQLDEALAQCETEKQRIEVYRRQRRHLRAISIPMGYLSHKGVPVRAHLCMQKNSCLCLTACVCVNMYVCNS
jgi:hypothetical protein